MKDPPRVAELKCNSFHSYSRQLLNRRTSHSSPYWPILSTYLPALMVLNIPLPAEPAIGGLRLGLILFMKLIG